MHIIDVDTPVGGILIACYEHVMLEIGTSTFIFQKQHGNEAFLVTKCWLKSVWESASVYGIFVSLPVAAVLSLQCVHEKLIIDLIFQQGFCEADVKAFNCVRLLLWVLSLEDITTGLAVKSEHITAPASPYTSISPMRAPWCGL